MLFPVVERGNEILLKKINKKKLVGILPTCPVAVCLPHLAAGMYTVRKMCTAVFRTQTSSVLLLRCIDLEVLSGIMHVKFGKV